MNHLRPRLASETPYTRLFLMPKVFLDILVCIIEGKIGHMVTNRDILGVFKIVTVRSKQGHTSSTIIYRFYHLATRSGKEHNTLRAI